MAAVTIAGCACSTAEEGDRPETFHSAP